MSSELSSRALVGVPSRAASGGMSEPSEIRSSYSDRTSDSSASGGSSGRSPDGMRPSSGWELSTVASLRGDLEARNEEFSKEGSALNTCPLRRRDVLQAPGRVNALTVAMTNGDLHGRELRGGRTHWAAGTDARTDEAKS